MDVLTIEALEEAINQVGGFRDMDMYTAFQFLYQCAQEKYPELFGGALQVIGGATLGYRLLSSVKLSGVGGKLIGMLGSVALNKK
jgi:hypothetical protein